MKRRRNKERLSADFNSIYSVPGTDFARGDLCFVFSSHVILRRWLTPCNINLCSNIQTCWEVEILTKCLYNLTNSRLTFVGGRYANSAPIWSPCCHFDKNVLTLEDEVLKLCPGQGSTPLLLLLNKLTDSSEWGAFPEQILSFSSSITFK